jgi:TusA-related sulfurtransferase
MKRYLQMLGEMRNYQLSQAKRAVQEMEADDELVIVVPEQSMAETIQQWAAGQGYTASNPKKGGEGMIRWHVTVQKGTQAGEKKPPAEARAPSA